MERLSLDRPVQTGFLLGVGLGFTLILWDAVRWLLWTVLPDARVLIAGFGMAILVAMLWVSVLRRER